MPSMIRVRVFSKNQDKVEKNSSPQRNFWRSRMPNSDESVESLENRLCRQFGQKFRNKLQEHFRDTLHELERATYGEEIHYMRKDLHFRDKYYADWGSALDSLIELRQNILVEHQDYSRLINSLLCVSETRFATKILGYSSLEFGIIPSNVQKLLEAFDNNTEILRVVLAQFIPDVFDNIFDHRYGGDFDFQIDLNFKVPPEAPKADTKPRSLTNKPQQVMQDEQILNRNEITHKAEWVWKLVNGSLLVPVILTLLVLYFVFQQIVAFKNTQAAAMEPVMKHYQWLLEEDRRRIELEKGIKKTAEPKKEKTAKKN